MAILESGEFDLMQLWGVITQLGEQLSQNQSMSVSLYSMAGKVKSQASNLQTGFVLRRFNLDKSQEEYDALLEQMNASMSLENQTILHDNKQLSTLIKEYEQTLETLMSTFRTRAQHVQERELTLIREFETKLLAREEENAKNELETSSGISESISRLSYLLRQVLRAQCGESPEPLMPPEDEAAERAPWTAAEAADRSLEREIELARLEKENEELRRMLGLLPPLRRPETSGDDLQPPFDTRRSDAMSVPHPNAVPQHKPAGVMNSGFGSAYQRMRSPG